MQVCPIDSEARKCLLKAQWLRNRGKLLGQQSPHAWSIEASVSQRSVVLFGNFQFFSGLRICVYI